MKKRRGDGRKRGRGEEGKKRKKGRRDELELFQFTRFRGAILPNLPKSEEKKTRHENEKVAPTDVNKIEKSIPNSPQTLPKPSQNPPKIVPKPSQIDLKSMKNRKKTQKPNGCQAS